MQLHRSWEKTEKAKCFPTMLMTWIFCENNGCIVYMCARWCKMGTSSGGGRPLQWWWDLGSSSAVCQSSVDQDLWYIVHGWDITLGSSPSSYINTSSQWSLAVFALVKDIICSNHTCTSSKTFNVCIFTICIINASIVASRSRFCSMIKEKINF